MVIKKKLTILIEIYWNLINAIQQTQLFSINGVDYFSFNRIHCRSRTKQTY